VDGQSRSGLLIAAHFGLFSNCAYFYGNGLPPELSQSDKQINLKAPLFLFGG